MADTRQYLGVDADAFACVKEKWESFGLHVPDGDSGDIVVDRGGLSFTIHFVWDTAAVLDLSVDDRPSALPITHVWAVTDECAKLCGCTVN